jgi:hypothetical protein
MNTEDFGTGNIQPKVDPAFNRATRSVAYSKKAISKLASLGFDPLEEMVKCHRNITEQIARQKYFQKLQDEGLKATGGKFSGMMLATLLAAEEKLLNDVLPYAYSKVPIDNSVTDPDLPPLIVNLTKKGDVYEINPVEKILSEDY